MGLTVRKPLTPTVPPSLTLLIHGMTDSSIRSQQSSRFTSREDQLHWCGSGPRWLPTSTSHHPPNSHRERQAGAHRTETPLQLSLSICPHGGNCAWLEPDIGEVMVQTREDPSPDHGG